MKYLNNAAAGFVLVLVVACAAWETAKAVRRSVVQTDRSYRLPDGVRIHPEGSRDVKLNGDLPLAMLQSADGTKCYVVTGGYHDHGIVVLNLADEISSLFIPTTKCTGGIVESENGSGYFTAGDLGIRRFTVTAAADAWSPVRFELPAGAWLQGLAQLPDGLLVTTDINHDQLICLDPKTLKTKWIAKVGHKPNRIAVNAADRLIAVTNWGGSSISLIDFDGTNSRTIAVGIHPSELTFAKDGALYVSNAGSNTVSVIKNGAVGATVFTSVTANDLVGSSPSGVALSPDQRKLFVANSGNNNVAQIDVTDPVNPKVEGFIPTAWYPTSVAVDAKTKRLIVGTAKGIRTAPNYPGVRPQQELAPDMRTRFDYLPNRLEGDAMLFDFPDSKRLADWTAECRRYAQREMSPSIQSLEARMIPTLRKIKHVLYVIRENRTYDQVLGDVTEANGDPNLCMYGRRITPNGHKIAKTFTTFDNLYCDGEVSQDGHQWCCSAYCTDFKEKTWPSAYAGRREPDEDPSVTNSPGGYLWDNCRKHGLTYRSYGLSSTFFADKNSAPRFEDDAGLKDHSSEAWSHSHDRDKDRVDVFIDELHEAERSGELPNLMVMSLGEDHTSGRKPGEYTPFSKVASNDVGLGKLVEAVSHSKFWATSAIFVIEDDAQDGPDHVDGHRTVGYVVSPYIKRGSVDGTMYSTASMIRTMELMLGLPPMSQIDRHATSMVASFRTTPDLTPFSHEDARIDLSARNPKEGPLAQASNKLDFSAYDLADPDTLNRILWSDAKPGHPYPVRSHLSR